MLDSLSVVPWEFDWATKRFVFVGPQASQYGYPIDDWYGDGFWVKLVHRDDLEEALAFCEAATENGEDYEFEYRIVKADGGACWVRKIVSVLDDGGNPPILSGIFVDIAKQKQAEKELKQRETELQVIFDNVPVRIWYKDDKNRILRLNKQAAQSMGMAVEDIEGANTYDLFPDMAKKYHDDDLKVINSNQAEFGIIEEYTPLGGERAWVSTDKVPFVDEETGERYVFVSSVDITALKQAQAHNLELATIIEDSLNEVYVFDCETLKFLQVNASACRNTGYTAEELAGLTPLDLKPEFTLEQFKDMIAPLRCGVKNHVRFQTIHRRKDGSHYDTGIVLQLIQSGDRPVFAAIIEDVTERKKNRNALQKQKEELHQILRNVPRAVITTDQTGIISTFNPAAREMFGYSVDEAIGQNVVLLMPERFGMHHDDYIEMYRNTRAANIVGQGPRQVAGRRKDGSEFPMELALAELGEGGKNGFVGIAKDITEQIAAEAHLVEHCDILQEQVDKATRELQIKADELETALAREKKLNELQRQFVSMASHEFRTPLTIIDSAAQRLKRRVDNGRLTPEDTLQRIDKVRDAVRRMTQLMDSTLSAAKMAEGKIATEIGHCDIGKIVEAVCERQQEITLTHRISCDLIEIPESIQADPRALDQVITNLLSNAVKYAPDAPDIAVRAWTEGPQIVISVRDHGLGIDEKEIHRIGERFFRAGTSTGIAGTGIGLNLVNSLLEMHGGSMKVESKKDQGSVFTICLPIAGPDESNRVNQKVA